jgi:hypothetical protein
MKAIINGLRYDTDKAILIGEASRGNRGDFSRWDAGLYRTPRSWRYFLAGEGGPMTQFGKGAPLGRTYGSRIIPMELVEAREWADHHLTADEVEAGFLAEIEDA